MDFWIALVDAWARVIAALAWPVLVGGVLYYFRDGVRRVFAAIEWVIRNRGWGVKTPLGDVYVSPGEFESAADAVESGAPAEPEFSEEATPDSESLVAFVSQVRQWFSSIELLRHLTIQIIAAKTGQPVRERDIKRVEGVGFPDYYRALQPNPDFWQRSIDWDAPALGGVSVESRNLDSALRVLLSGEHRGFQPDRVEVFHDIVANVSIAASLQIIGSGVEFDDVGLLKPFLWDPKRNPTD